MKILVVMKNWLGDLLFQMPALDLIKEKYPQALITCVAPERCREILEAHPAVSGFMAFDEKSTHRPLFARFQFLFQLRKLGPWDQGYLFHRSRTRALLLMLAGVKERIGFGKERKWLLTRPLPEPAQSMHQLDYFLEMMRLAGFEVPRDSAYKFYYKKEDRETALRLLKAEGLDRKGSFICFHLGANWEPKRWPAEHFAALAGKIWEVKRLPVVVTGSRQDQLLLDAFLKKIRDARVISFVGQTGLGVSAAIYEEAACLVTGDSGPMHIASGIGAKVVALFGPTDPKLTGPRGTGESLVLHYVPEGYSVPFYPVTKMKKASIFGNIKERFLRAPNIMRFCHPRESGDPENGFPIKAFGNDILLEALRSFSKKKQRVDFCNGASGKELPRDGWMRKITPEQVFDAVERLIEK